MYNLKSKIAEEFINHEEIIESIEFGRKNSKNKALFGEIETHLRIISLIRSIITS